MRKDKLACLGGEWVYKLSGLKCSSEKSWKGSFELAYRRHLINAIVSFGFML